MTNRSRPSKLSSHFWADFQALCRDGSHLFCGSTAPPCKLGMRYWLLVLLNNTLEVVTWARRRSHHQVYTPELNTHGPCRKRSHASAGYSHASSGSLSRSLSIVSALDYSWLVTSCKEFSRRRHTWITSLGRGIHGQTYRDQVAYQFRNRLCSTHSHWISRSGFSLTDCLGVNFNFS